MTSNREPFRDKVSAYRNTRDRTKAADTPIMATVPHHPEDGDKVDYGYFASTEEQEDEIELFAEPWQRYDKKKTASVFYPIRIGDVLDQRYRVDHKLGHGGFSTVWMAYDLQVKRDVALKIMVAGESGEHEFHMQKEIIQSVKDTSHLVTYLATFLLRGEKCNHRVLVFPLLGQYLDYLTLKTKSMATRMSAARQLLEALGNLHKAGILHRDLNDRNCIWGMVPLDNFSRDAKYKVFGRPLKETIDDELWKQGDLVKPLEVPEDLCTETFYLADFGLAMKFGAPVTPQGRPPSKYCSPDRLHNQDPSFACDMWSYMCIFAQLYLGVTPFPTGLEGGIVTTMVKSLGPLPKRWKGHYIDPDSSLDSWYDQDEMPDPRIALEGKIARLRPEADPMERQHILSIMSRGFNTSPERRITAMQLLQDPSFKAIMDKYCH